MQAMEQGGRHALAILAGQKDSLRKTAGCLFSWIDPLCLFHPLSQFRPI